MDEPSLDSAVTVSLDLIRRAQGGDLDAYDRLFERYYERVRRIVRVRMGARLRLEEESADIIQKTFLAAIDLMEDFEVRDEASLINWLAQIAENRIKRAAEHAGAAKRDRRREVALDHVVTSLSSGSLRLEPAADLPLPIEELEGAEKAEILEQCIAELREDYREAILLRHFADASWAAIAEALGRPTEAAARMLHARAMVDLSELVRRRLA
jgi:RNA polymerase sigma-70 factor (ECF subfamily)